MPDRDDASGRRRLDALTNAELAATRRGFWDEAFTDVLLRRVPAGARALVDVGCGLAPAAHALLPKAPELSYIGVDADAQRLGEARKLLAGEAYGERIDLRAGRAERLPCRDGEAGSSTVGYSCQLVPVFVCVARKPGAPDAA